MIVFVSICVAMLLVAAALIGYPLLKAREGEPNSQRVSVFILASLTMSLLAGVVYVGNTTWSWRDKPQTQATQGQGSAEIEALLAKANNEPDNVENWKALGRAYVTAGSFAPGANAFQKAYELTQGKDVEVLTGLAEALVMTDQTSLNGRVGVLIDQALQLKPNNPKALWYGGLVALQMDNLQLARDRFQTMLALDPPQNVRTLLERQIQDLNQQLGEAAMAAAPNAAAAPTAKTSARKVLVKVTLSPGLQLKSPTALFILARNPAQPGPPLAVERHQSTELPLQVELSAEDAMLPTRTLAAAEDVQIVARLSSSGMPTEHAGDLFGTANYSFTKQGEQGSVTIEINQRVP
jgi:cytochrome c-type biogenesis protein CcmH